MTNLETLATGNYRLPCPKCDKDARDNALSVTIEAPGQGVFHCFRCEWAGPIGRTTQNPIRRIERKPDRNKLDRIKALIRRAAPIRGTLAERYLRSRAIELPKPGELFDDAALRFVPDAWHWPSESKLPCMVGVVTNAATNEIQAAHQTFLNPDGTGKAAVEMPRLYFGPKSGGVLRLTADENVTTGLAIAEGIETAFAGLIAGYPTWACLDAGNLAAFPVLDGIEALTILADNDEHGKGMEAAQKCAVTWGNREVRIAQTSSDDWNERTKEIANA